MNTKFEQWTPGSDDALNGDTEGGVLMVQEQDPRAILDHAVGVLPVPPNPPPPVGWEYWGKQHIPAAATQLCVTMLHDPGTFPMGSFVRIMVGTNVIGARVEWHDFQGATGKKGCFRGVNLLRKVDGQEVLDKP